MNSITYQRTSLDRLSIAMDPEVKYLGVEVSRAYDLADTDSGIAGKSDPFFIARIGAKAGIFLKPVSSYSTCAQNILKRLLLNGFNNQTFPVNLFVHQTSKTRFYK